MNEKDMYIHTGYVHIFLMKVITFNYVFKELRTKKGLRFEGFNNLNVLSVEFWANSYSQRQCFDKKT